MVGSHIFETYFSNCHMTATENDPAVLTNIMDTENTMNKPCHYTPNGANYRHAIANGI